MFQSLLQSFPKFKLHAVQRVRFYAITVAQSNKSLARAPSKEALRRKALAYDYAYGYGYGYDYGYGLTNWLNKVTAILLETLIELKSPSCKFLHLLND